MVTPVVMPKLGNTVESSIIVSWKKAVGDLIAEGDVLCEVETDKATMEVESPVSGMLLAQFFAEGDDVNVMTNIAAIGESGEAFDALLPTSQMNVAPVVATTPLPSTPPPAETSPISAPLEGIAASEMISPRARHLAERKKLDVSGLQGTGPGGRIIERDIEAALAARPVVTPLAKAMLEKGAFAAPERGTGARGKVTSKDLIPQSSGQSHVSNQTNDVNVITIKGARKIIAERMLHSLQTTAQLTLNASADARALMQYRKRLKNSPAALGLASVTINDLVLFAVAQTLPDFPDLNALFEDETIYQHRRIHLGVAVDTARGLIVPVIREAHTLRLKRLADEAHRLAEACLQGRISPDELHGGTFSVTNLGSLGIESFTPVLNPPQVAILGVSNINLKPVEIDDEVQFIPHMGLSLTINHQVVDGAPGARFLQALSHNLANIDLLLAGR